MMPLAIGIGINLSLSGARGGGGIWRDLVALWDFSSLSTVRGSAHTLGPVDGATITLESDSDAPFGSVAVFDGSGPLQILAASVGDLNLAAAGDKSTVVAWINHATPSAQAFYGGCWDESNNRRQYGLFTNLANWGGQNRACGHISATGAATAGYTAAIDYSATRRAVGPGNWHMIAATYDGALNTAYLDGFPDEYKAFTDAQDATYDKNPYAYALGLNRTTELSDFTCGGNLVGGNWASKLTGKIGGLAVWRRALSPAEILELSLMTPRAGGVIFHADFYVSATGQLGGNWGWQSVRGPTAEVTSFDPQAANMMMTTSSGNTFLYRSTINGDTAAANTTTESVAWFPLAGLQLGQIGKLSYRLNHASNLTQSRLVICVNGSWYVTATADALPSSGATASNWATAVTREVSDLFGAETWKHLTLIPGSSLSIGEDAGSIADGELGAIGVWGSAIPNATNFRVRDIKIFGK